MRAGEQEEEEEEEESRVNHPLSEAKQDGKDSECPGGM
jgi:hypothetical protein